MSKNLIVLEDGTEITSGREEYNAIQSITLTESVNSDEELTLGSACASILEATIFTPRGGVTLNAGAEVTLYKVDDDGARTKKGIFILEKPTRPSANTIKFTGYDRMIKLDKDLTAWLEGLGGWPYCLIDFARMVCAACGLTLVTEAIPNGDFPVPQFQYSEVTGRELMKWIGEICCRFCRANADGDIELAWYAPSGKHITHSAEPRYFAKGLSYETYEVAPIDAVQIKLADSDTGGLWPEADDGANSYIISGNPFLQTEITNDLLPYLQVIKEQLDGVTYTPCKISMSADPDVLAGSIVEITDINGVTITAYVMSRTETGRKVTLECTGSHRRDSSTATNSRTKTEDRVNELMIAVKGFDGKKIVSMINLSEDTVKIQGEKIQLEGTVTANEHFKILKDGSIEANAGVVGGCEIKDGQLIVPMANVTGTLIVKDVNDKTLFSAGDNKVQIAGWNADENSFYSGDSFSTADCFFCTGSSGEFKIGSSGYIKGWVLKAGNSFGVTKEGTLYADDVHLSGEIIAEGGSIGNWDVYEGRLCSPGLTVQLGDDGLRTQVNGALISTDWEPIAYAGRLVARGASGSFNITGKTYTFTDGILTEIKSMT